MTKSTTIIINGKVYHAITGMPVTSAGTGPAASPAAKRSVPQPLPPTAPKFVNDIGPSRGASVTVKPLQAPILRPDIQRAKPMATAAATDMHQRTQKSHTLYRKALKKPETSSAGHQPLRPGSIPRSPLITKFGTTAHSAQAAGSAPAPHSQSATSQQPATPNVTPLHPVVAKALQRQASNRTNVTVPQRSSKELKELLIKERLAEVGDEPKKSAHRTKRRPRLGTILASSLALLILGGYLTYMNLPVISMKVAASRAGINAQFPDYKPDGYGLNGPIAYAPGEVIINYKSNSSSQNFKLTQQASSWDSQAVLDNYVAKQTDTYLTFQERGVTVYTFGNKAAWVNGGLLHTIDGDASLSSEQVLRVATSM